MAIINIRKIKGLRDTEVYSMINAVHIDKSADTVTLEMRHYKDEATRQADIKDFLHVEHVILDEDFPSFAGQVDSIAKGYEKAKEKDQALASGTDC